jgi:hypothetical protein
MTARTKSELRIVKKRYTALSRKFADATLELDALREKDRKSELWLQKAKEAAGFHRNTSFDVVWNAVLQSHLNRPS